MKNYYSRRNWDQVKEKCPVFQVKKDSRGKSAGAKAVIDCSGLNSGFLKDTYTRNFRRRPYLE